jgi:hypothetical protein
LLSVESLEDRSVPAFLGAVNYATDPYPYAVVAADFNHDGQPDLAVANSYSNTVSVLLGNPDGTFQAAKTSPAGGSPLSLAVGDFDGDGNLDLVAAEPYGLAVMLGDGTGGLGAPTTIGMWSNPNSVAVGDFNGDGKLDIAAASNITYWGYYGGYTTSYANVLLGNGGGTFGDPSFTWMGYGYHAGAVAADLNGDGLADFASNNSDYGYVTVALNDGFGNLGSPIDYSGVSGAQGLAAGDVDGDGDKDLVTSGGYYQGAVLRNDGTGAFGPATYYNTPGFGYGVALADVNHDNKLDIVSTSYYNGATVNLGRGDGTFSLPISTPVGSNPIGVAAGDFNGDGWDDVATANNSGSNVSVLLNDHNWPPADAPSVSIADASVTEGNTGSVNMTFTVSLSASYTQAIIVHFATADGSATAGSDYTAASNDLTFNPGDTSKTITISVTGDRLPESNEYFSVNLSTNSAFIADGQAIGTIVDNEPKISINDVALKEGNGKSTTQFIFTVTLSNSYDQAVTVNFATADWTATVADHDYQARSGTLTFAPGETSKQISISVYGDAKKESNEYFYVNLSGASSNSLIYDSQGVGTIINDDNKGKGH